VTAVGDHWGPRSREEPARSEHVPLGVCFELAHGDAADAVPPGGARTLAEYLSP